MWMKKLSLCVVRENKRQTMYEECLGYSNVELFSWALSQIWIFVRLLNGGSGNEYVIKRIWFYELPFIGKQYYSENDKIKHRIGWLLYDTSGFWPRVRARALRAPVFLGSLPSQTGRCAPPPPPLVYSLLLIKENYKKLCAGATIPPYFFVLSCFY